MQVTSSYGRRTENSGGGGSPDGSPGAAWGVAAIEAKDILPGGPEERRRRNRLFALRAMDRLGVLGEEDLIAALAARSDLGWLVDEEGAKWGILTELGRIREQKKFEAAVEWVLSARPRTEEARARIWLFRVDTTGLPGVEARADRPPHTGRRRAGTALRWPRRAESEADGHGHKTSSPKEVRSCFVALLDSSRSS